MAAINGTNIADVIVPEVFTSYVQLLTSQKSAFVQSGVTQSDAQLDSFLAGGGQLITMPRWNDLTDTESNVSTDDDSLATPDPITAIQEIAIRHNRNHSWQSADLAAALAGSDPMEAIASRVSDYWVRQLQSLLISSVQGCLLDEAGDADGMTSNITAGSGTVTAAHRFSAEAFLDAQQTMGDQGDRLTAVAMHSVVFTRAQKNNLIDFIPDARGEVQIPFYLGRRVVVDDGLPTVADGGNTEYSTYLFGEGAIALGVGSPRVPTEIDRNPAQGTGGGNESLYSRVEWVLHPRGFSFDVTGSVAGKSPTNTEAALAANWDRVYTDRNLVPFAELITNG